MIDRSENLRKAIENLMNAKLHDAIGRPDGVSRLAAHRCSGVASQDIRSAERQLELVLADILAAGPATRAAQAGVAAHRPRHAAADRRARRAGPGRPLGNAPGPPR